MVLFPFIALLSIWFNTICLTGQSVGNPFRFRQTVQTHLSGRHVLQVNQIDFSGCLSIFTLISLTSLRLAIKSPEEFIIFASLFNKSLLLHYCSLYQSLSYRYLVGVHSQGCCLAHRPLCRCLRQAFGYHVSFEGLLGFNASIWP